MRPGSDRLTHRRLVRYLYRVNASVLVCGAVFDSVSDDLGGRTEILVRDGLISEIRSPDDGDTCNLAQQTL